MKIHLGADDDPLIARAAGMYQRESAQSCGKMRIAEGLDPSRLTRIATICHWGRSGSMLLASLLDDHPQVLALPQSLSTCLYNFHDDYGRLDLWQRLLVYPFYSAQKGGDEGDFFLADTGSGDFAIEPAQYVAAVEALAAYHGAQRAGLPVTSRAFVQYLHAAYAVAIGKSFDASRAIMITAQHYVNDELAGRLAADFPGAKFIHTVRDPISSVDSWFDRRVEMARYALMRDKTLVVSRFDCAVATLMDLLAWDCGHAKFASDTRAVHLKTSTSRPNRRCESWPRGSRFRTRNACCAAPGTAAPG